MRNQVFKLEDKLTTAFRRCILRIKDEFLGKSVYAFVVYPSSGYRDIGIAFSTREDLPQEDGGFDAELQELLRAHPDLLALSTTVSSPPTLILADEWNFIRPYTDLFVEINDEISSSYDYWQDSEICGAFTDMIIQSLKTLVSEGHFTSPPFETDTLLGIQFPDSGICEIAIRASSELNSKTWHEQLTKFA